ncbi:MAG: hypothetical protein IJW83_00595 [Clostridia bacterium]|nr:hypothetical protein [Clostridia bacterium]
MAGTDAQVHSGHRQRMRDKFIRHGADVFDTHELLEMLLYYVIPYKDTNPIAHRLLERFSTLEGVFLAEVGQLCEVSGIGEEAARFLRSVGQNGNDGLFICEEGEAFNDYERVGSYLRSVYQRTDDKQVYLILLDNRMRFLAIEPMGDEPFSVVARHAQPFVKQALLSSAAVVIVAHTHPYGPLFLTPEERATDAVLKENFARAGIAYAEHYLFCGDSYIGCLSHEDIRFRQYEALEEFKRSRLCASHTQEATDASDARPGPLFEDARAFLSRMLSSVCAKGRLDATVEALFRRYGLVRRILESDITSLMDVEAVTPALAVYIKLLVAMTARRVTDGFTFGQLQSTEDIRRYFIYRMYGADVERVYMMMLDEQGAPIACPCVSEGAVNSSGITPRRFLEIAVRAGAHSVLLAHNHPGGSATASDEDHRATQMLQAAFQSAGIRLRDHMVVAGNTCISMAESSSGLLDEQYSFRFAQEPDPSC